jgi:hypothetical protein
MFVLSCMPTSSTTKLKLIGKGRRFTYTPTLLTCRLPQTAYVELEWTEIILFNHACQDSKSRPWYHIELHAPPSSTQKLPTFQNDPYSSARKIKLKYDKAVGRSSPQIAYLVMLLVFIFPKIEVKFLSCITIHLVRDCKVCVMPKHNITQIGLVTYMKHWCYYIRCPFPWARRADLIRSSGSPG